MNQHEITNAQWFAPHGVETRKNVYFRAHRVLDVGKLQSPFQIAAETLYRLYLNGEFIGEGPARGTKSLTFFDEYDLSSAARDGDNHLAVEVCCFNIHNFKYAPQRPALWTNLDEKWRVQIAQDWREDAPLYTFQTGFCEWRDTRLEPVGWMIGEDTSPWQTPVLFEIDKVLLPRDIPFLHCTQHQPRELCVVAKLDAIGLDDDIGLAQRISDEPHFVHPQENEIRAQFAQDRVLDVCGDTALIFDFGTELTGALELEIEASSGTTFDIGYEEILAGGRMNVLPLGANDTEYMYAFADRVIARGGVQTWKGTLNERGFRFVQITIRGHDKVSIRAVRALDRRYPLEVRPTIQSGDALLDRVYDTCVVTLSTCATDVLTDCPWREAAFWVNDFVVNARFWMHTFGDTQLVERGLRLALSSPRENGLIDAVCPAGEKTNFIFLSTNSFLPLIVRDLRDACGEWTPFIAPLEKVMRALQSFEDEDGLLVSPAEYWNFLDWSYGFLGHDIGARACAAQSWFYLMALDAMTELTGDDVWQKRADRVLDGLTRRFWDADRGVFREFDGEETTMQLTQSLAILSGRCDVQKPVLMKALESGDLLGTELYMMTYVLRALAENGRREKAIELIHQFWTPLIEGGSPTIWEANVYQHGKAAYNGSGSLCHAFACAPLLILLPQSSTPKVMRCSP